MALCRVVYATVSIMVICMISLVSVGDGYVIQRVETQTPGQVKESDLTCYTCPNKTNNTECNKWAPEEFCPGTHTTCHTIHRFDSDSGTSVYVNKRCALPKECVPGCHRTDIPGVQECVSCCTTPYCNEAVPSNHNTALMLSATSSADTVLAHVWTLVFMASMVY